MSFTAEDAAEVHKRRLARLRDLAGTRLSECLTEWKRDAAGVTHKCDFPSPEATEAACELVEATEPRLMIDSEREETSLVLRLKGDKLPPDMHILKRPTFGLVDAIKMKAKIWARAQEQKRARLEELQEHAGPALAECLRKLKDSKSLTYRCHLASGVTAESIVELVDKTETEVGARFVQQIMAGGWLSHDPGVKKWDVETETWRGRSELSQSALFKTHFRTEIASDQVDPMVGGETGYPHGPVYFS